MENRHVLKSLTEANLPTWNERAAIHIKDTTGFYAIDRFRKGEDIMMAIESSEIGDVSGKRLLHLQCHIGLETLCLARRGAIATGLDFSNVSIEAARKLSEETHLSAVFVQADVYDALQVLSGSFDIVYVSWGSLNWLPDIWEWGQIVARFLAPSGYLYVVEQHPTIAMMSERNGRLEPVIGWRTPITRPIVTALPMTYNGDALPLVNPRMHEWQHPLSDIVNSLIKAGLRLDFLNEHPVLAWKRFPMMVGARNRFFCLPDHQVPLPLAFSLKASKV